FDFVKSLTHEKHCIQISKHVINHGKIMDMEKKEDKWRKPRSMKGCG
ncbi:type I restriction-modification enzyme, R subunit, partial [Trichinella spiralis]